MIKKTDFFNSGIACGDESTLQEKSHRIGKTMTTDAVVKTCTGYANRRFSRLASFVIIVTVCIISTDARSAEKTLPFEGGELFKVGDSTAFLILPKEDKSEAPLPWVWYAPTLSGLPNAEWRLPNVDEEWMFQQFLENGIAIAGVDVGESFGNPKGRSVYSAFYKELTEKRGLAQRACLLARSRGGLMLYNWAAENPDHVACIAGIYPVCNLSSYPGLDRASSAYNMTREQFETELVKHNPIDRLDGLATAKVPIFHIHGSGDTVVPLDENSAVVKERYEQLGGQMELEIVEGKGHNRWPGWFHSQTLVDFVIVHAKGHSSKAVNAALITYYYDDFSGLQTETLNGTIPDITPGTETWTADAGYTADGSIDNTTMNASAYLPFFPQAGKTYRISVDVSNLSSAVSSRWAGIGFGTAALGIPQSLCQNTRGVTALILRINGQVVAYRDGANAAAAAGGYGNAETLSMVLTTHADNTPWTVDYYAGTTKIGSYAWSSGGNPGIASVAISSNGDDLDGNIENFCLTVIPKPVP